MKILRYDLLALLLSLSIFAGVLFWGAGRSGEGGSLLIETSRGDSLYPLGEDREILLEGPVGESVVAIRGGAARFIHSDCPDQLCVTMGAVSEPGDWAACLPNRIFLSVSGGEGSREVDAGVY